jgi:hypothetical protein
LRADEQMREQGIGGGSVGDGTELRPTFDPAQEERIAARLLRRHGGDAIYKWAWIET